MSIDLLLVLLHKVRVLLVVSLTYREKKSWQKRRIYDDRKGFAVSFYVTCFRGNLANIVPTSIVRKAPKPKSYLVTQKK